MPDGDIFDQAAAKMASPSASGDIWDQAAAKMSSRPSEAEQAANAPMPGVKNPMKMTNLITGGQDQQYSPEQEAYLQKTLPMVPQQVADLRKTALAVGGAAFGGSAVQGAGMIPALLRMGGAGAGAATGNVVGAASAGQMPSAKEALQVGAGAALGQGIAETPFMKWLASSKSAGANLLQKASSSAGNAPVELSPATDALVEKITTQSKLGGKMPKVVSDMLERLGPSTKLPADAAPNPLTYNEARILQSNISQLSAEEEQQFKGSLKGLMKQLAGSFSRDVQQAADQAGVGAEHAAGMKEYALASSRNRALAKMANYGIKGTIGGGIGYELLRRK